jgi:hypothetical protein
MVISPSSIEKVALCTKEGTRVSSLITGGYLRNKKSVFLNIVEVLFQKTKLECLNKSETLYIYEQVDLLYMYEQVRLTVNV